MNAKMVCQSVTRRVGQALRIGPSLRFHKIRNVPCSRTYSSEAPPRREREERSYMKQSKVGLEYPGFQINTLNPTKITKGDILDLSGIGECTINACGDKTNVRYKPLGPDPPFPPGTKGVFYFHDRTNVHPVAGDIRFRILPLDAAQDWASVNFNKLFADGEDLVSHDGLGPWHISLLSIIYRQRPGFLNLLKQCEYISQAAEMQVEHFRLSIAARSHNIPRGMRGQIIDQIIDPFLVDLGLHFESHIFLQRECITSHEMPLRQLTIKRYNGRYEMCRAYSGKALVRFEMIWHEKRSCVVLRILKFLRPPNPNDIVVQEEGELLKTYHSRDGTETPWMADRPLKFMTPSSVKLLEETYLSKTTIS